ncbi:hypothetical protein BDA96_06G105500 [Sorghum bicolor]|jgi:hypothetical protein|uniref:Uncharacterized protein n=1 Tax=Sorghum bicolor TaxID=4558 RepID=A0A921QPP7_SORBI|nr:hypothetical protein BDA96_06G105500 [Sorghum bicolor]
MTTRARILAQSLSATYSAENAIERSASETLIYCLGNKFIQKQTGEKLKKTKETKN